MRISGGEARGIRLHVPRGARPASERVRHAVFSSLAPYLADARVLDLYCGSGAYGLEALSRGAAEAVFVDRDRSALDAVTRNARDTGLEERTRFRRRPVERYLSKESRSDGLFDVVFVDPPYDLESVVHVLDGLRGAVRPGGRVVIESRWGGSESTATGFILEADRRYGDTRVRVYVREDRDPQEER